MNQEQPIGSDQQGLVSARRRSEARWEPKSRVALTEGSSPNEAEGSDEEASEEAWEDVGEGYVGGGSEGGESIS